MVKVIFEVIANLIFYIYICAVFFFFFDSQESRLQSRLAKVRGEQVENRHRE